VIPRLSRIPHEVTGEPETRIQHLIAYMWHDTLISGKQIDTFSVSRWSLQSYISI
jgi:hypothetical protein